MKPIVILVPGWGVKKAFEWDISPFDGWFKECGFEVVKFKQDHHGLCSISHNADKLREVIDECKSSSHTNVYVVGHSMGGLVAKEASHYNYNVQGFATLGTPHKGTALAYLGAFSESAREMCPGVNYLSLYEFVDTYYDYFPRMLSVGGRFDCIVPCKNSFSELSNNNVTVNHTHLSMIFSRKVFNIVRDFLLQY